MLDAAGGRAPVTVTVTVTGKFNMPDGVRGGFEIEDAVQVARWLEADGTVDAVKLTAGSSLLDLFRSDASTRWQQGSGDAGGCTHCNLCMPTIDTGTLPPGGTVRLRVLLATARRAAAPCAATPPARRAPRSSGRR